MLRRKPTGPDELPFRIRDYLDDVIQFAETRTSEIVSVVTFGSVDKNGFSQSVSDVDLIIALADDVPRKTQRMICGELATLELKHKLRKPPGSKREAVYTVIDDAAGHLM